MEVLNKVESRRGTLSFDNLRKTLLSISFDSTSWTSSVLFSEEVRCVSTTAQVPRIS